MGYVPVKVDSSTGNPGYVPVDLKFLSYDIDCTAKLPTISHLGCLSFDKNV